VEKLPGIRRNREWTRLGGQAANKREYGRELQNQLPFGQAMSAHVQNLDSAAHYSIDLFL
jgi:hypothetical protein